MVRVSYDTRDEACMYRQRPADPLSLTLATLRKVKERVRGARPASPALLESPLVTEPP